MDGTVRIDADEVYPGSGGTDPACIDTLGFARLHVSLAGEARCNGDEISGAEYRCKHCSTPLRENNTGMTDDADWQSADDDTVTCERREDGGGHEPEPVPGSFANSVWAAVGDDDSVTVAISVGDPRGAFTMTVWRSSADGKLRLSVPDPSDGLPHMALKQVRPGHFEIGN